MKIKKFNEEKEKHEEQDILFNAKSLEKIKIFGMFVLTNDLLKVNNLDLLFFKAKKTDFENLFENNIKNNVSPVDYYVNETVYHEAVHVAQACKGKPLGVNVSLDAYKMNDVVRSVKVGNSYPVYESEAYFLEDKPEQVLYYLKKFCF